MTQARVPGMFTTDEAARVAGCTFRQVDYWVRTHRITPTIPATGSGSYAWWSPEEVARLWFVSDRIEWGMTVDAAFRDLDPPLPPMPEPPIAPTAPAKHDVDALRRDVLLALGTSLLTRSDVADRVCVHPSTITRFLNGSKNISVGLAAQLCDLFGLNLTDYLAPR